jgi:hypothetical protein
MGKGRIWTAHCANKLLNKEIVNDFRVLISESQRQEFKIFLTLSNTRKGPDFTSAQSSTETPYAKFQCQCSPAG